MPGFGNYAWGNWFYGLIAGFIGGGAGAVVSGISVSMIDSKDFSIGSAKFFGLVGIIFLSHGTISALMFLKQQPLPAVITTTTTVETTARQQDPPAVVKTIVSETRIDPQPPQNQQ